MKNTNLKNTIKCPYCDTEYLPCEIYYPDYFLGQEKDIERDTLGEVIYYSGLESDTSETFICEKCKKQFKVEADIKFKTYKDNKNNLNNDYFTPKPLKLFLDEN